MEIKYLAHPSGFAYLKSSLGSEELETPVGKLGSK
jgi:hypothetical protein